MRTERSANLFGFKPVEGRVVVASFDGGSITSDAGALLLGATDKVLGLTRRLTEWRETDVLVHATLPVDRGSDGRIVAGPGQGRVDGS